MSSSELEKTTSPFTVLVFVTRKAGMSFEEFKSYYENHHVPLITRVLKGENCYQSYTRHFVDRSDASTFPFGNENSIAFDCLARSEYRNRQAYEKTLQVFKDHIQEIDEDEKKFLDQSKTVFVVTGEGPGEIAVK